MIDTVEKITWGLGALTVLLVGTYFVVAGPPSSTPYIAMEGKEVTRNEILKRLSPDAKKELDKTLNAAPAGADGTKGSSRGRAKNTPTKYRTVNYDVYKRVRNLTDAIHESKKASSRVIDEEGRTSLQIYDFARNSVLGTVGFEEDDIIHSIGGENIDFRSAGQAKALYDQCREQMELGQPLVVDLSRNGKPMQIVIAPDW